MVNFEHAMCPNCGKRANSRDEVKRLFGIRDANQKYPRVQSWCKECR